MSEIENNEERNIVQEEVRHIRPKLFCMSCGTQGHVEELVYPTPIPSLKPKLSKLSLYECKLCGTIVYKEAIVVAILLSI